jgi:Protein of unknown function (DUF3667)
MSPMAADGQYRQERLLMSMDLEPAGALATAGLVAKEIEGDAGKTAHSAHRHERCANCSVQLVGPYCHRCGQFGHVHRSLLHLLEELVHGILHFDTRSWRTLPLLFVRPGLLTRRYIDGQRTRYVSPLALFLFSVFLMFFVFSTVAGSDANSRTRTAAGLEESRKDLSQEIDSGRKRAAKAEAKVAQAKTAEEREDAADDLAEARSDLHESEVSLAALDRVAGTSAQDAGLDQSAPHVRWPATMERIAQKHSQTHPTLARLARHVAANPDLMLYKMKNSAYKLAFMLIPISLPFLWLMFFWRKGITMYDHTIFTLYGLSFLSLWWALLALLGKSHWTEGLAAPALLYQPAHLFMQLKETYALGWFAATWRTVALLVAGGIVLGLFTLLVLFISLS